MPVIAALFALVSSALPYFDAHGRLFWQLAASAYCDDALLEQWNCSECAASRAHVSHITIVDNPQTDARAYVGVMHDAQIGLPPNAIVVAFRGSSTLENWIENIQTSKVPEQSVACSGCMVHKGFHDAWRSIAKQVVARVLWLRTAVAQDASVFVVGHSLGGALAQFAAIELAVEHNLRPSGVFTFGCPRVGNANFSHFANATLVNEWRVTHWKDPVPHLPFVSGPYPSVAGYWHTPREVFYDETSTSHRTCNGSGEDGTCSAQFPLGVTTRYIHDHLTYFGSTGVGKVACAHRSTR